MEDNFESNNQEWNQKYTPNEQEYITYIESLPEVENEFESEKCNYDRKLWNYFQSCALAIAQLYRDNVNMQHNLWNSFQQASSNVACLYKECSEFQKKMYDINHQNGYHKRTKELLTWAKKKKSHIRREDLLAFLSGRPSNHVHNNYYHHRFSRARANRNSEDIQRFLNSSSPNSRASSRLLYNDSISESSNLTPINQFNNSHDDETNLETFREAISTMSSYRNSANLISSNSRKSPRNNEDLSEFINSEIYRHVESRKRTSSMDVCMDSPTHNKRTKFC